MKVESTIMPNNLYEIEYLQNNMAKIKFFDEIQLSSKSADDSIIWEWNEYTIELKMRDNLKEQIEKNFSYWLDYAKQKEYDIEANKIRKKRDQLLAESDKQMCIDRINLIAPTGNTFLDWLGFLQSFSQYLNGEWAQYRQSLRDVPQQKGFPFNVTFPKKPKNF